MRYPSRRRPAWVVPGLVGLTAVMALLAWMISPALTSHLSLASASSAAGSPLVLADDAAKCMDDNKLGTADGTIVQIWDCNGGVNQKWQSVRGTLVNTRSGKCLDDPEGASANGTGLQIWTCNGGANQQWKLTHGALVNPASGKCVADPGHDTANGTQLVLMACTGDPGQNWSGPGPASAPTPTPTPTVTSGGGGSSGPTRSTRVTVWGVSVNPGGRGFDNQTVREVVHASAGGTDPQVRISNLYGSGTLDVAAVAVAVQASGGTAVAGTEHSVTFGGSRSVLLAAGGWRDSDAVPMTVRAGQNLLVSLYVSNSVTSSTWHSEAGATTWISAAGNHAADTGTSHYPATTGSDYLLAALTVSSPTATGAVVAFGDSITDGYGSPDNTNERYPDDLARRLDAVAGGPVRSVVNAGIAGNRILTDAGPVSGFSALHRFSRDALSWPGVRDVILLEGINDLRGTHTTGQQIIAADRTLIAQAHAAGVKIFGATILPCGGAAGWTAGQDAQRGIVNTWIRTSGAFDGVIDFDAALRDPSDPSRMIAADNRGDHLHPNSAGYQLMANTVKLSLFA